MPQQVPSDSISYLWSELMLTIAVGENRSVTTLMFCFTKELIAT